MLNNITKPSNLFLVFAICFCCWTMDLWRAWHFDQTNFVWDVANYYSYLPAKFCNNNSFEFGNGVEMYLPTGPDGKHIPKVTYGMSLMYSPFFALGYKIAINQKDPRDGFSEPFRTTIHWGSIIYGLLGLILLRNFLVKYFTEIVTTITLAIVFFGTTLFYYVMGNSEMAHGYLFFLISAFLLSVYHWHTKPTIFKSVLIGLLIGVISLIRPTEILVGLLFLFWGVHNKESLNKQLVNLWENKVQFIYMILAFLVIWIPQFIFWKNHTGNYFFFSYGDEKFFWGDPQIINVLFSYRKGWLMYTPLASLVFIGLFFMRNEVKKFRPVILFLLLLNIYMLSCWWDWFFGGGFGARAFTQHFAYLSLPIASLVAYFVQTEFVSKIMQFLKVVFVAVVFSGISLSVGQTYQYVKLYIHYNSMTNEAYWWVFGKYYLDDDHAAAIWGKIKEPDYEKLRSGEDRDQ